MYIFINIMLFLCFLHLSKFKSLFLFNLYFSCCLYTYIPLYHHYFYIVVSFVFFSLSCNSSLMSVSIYRHIFISLSILFLPSALPYLYFSFVLHILAFTLSRYNSYSVNLCLSTEYVTCAGKMSPNESRLHCANSVKMFA